MIAFSGQKRLGHAQMGLLQESNSHFRRVSPPLSYGSPHPGRPPPWSRVPLIAMWPEYKVVYPPIGGTWGESDSHIEVTGMLVVSLRSVNCRFWSKLGCLGWKVITLHVSLRVVHKEIYKKSRDTNHTERYQGV